MSDAAACELGAWKGWGPVSLFSIGVSAGELGEQRAREVDSAAQTLHHVPVGHLLTNPWQMQHAGPWDTSLASGLCQARGPPGAPVFRGVPLKRRVESGDRRSVFCRHGTRVRQLKGLFGVAPGEAFDVLGLQSQFAEPLGGHGQCVGPRGHVRQVAVDDEPPGSARHDEIGELFGRCLARLNREAHPEVTTPRVELGHEIRRQVVEDDPPGSDAHLVDKAQRLAEPFPFVRARRVDDGRRMEVARQAELLQEKRFFGLAARFQPDFADGRGAPRSHKRVHLGQDAIEFGFGRQSARVNADGDNRSDARLNESLSLHVVEPEKEVDQRAGAARGHGQKGADHGGFDTGARHGRQVLRTAQKGVGVRVDERHEQSRAASEDESREVLVLNHVGKARLDVGAVDDHVLVAHLRGVEGELVEQAFEDGVEAPRADVLGAIVDRLGHGRDLVDGLVAHLDLESLGFEQRRVLADERVLRFGEDAHHVLARERFELDADGKSPLQLGDEIARLGDMKGAGGDEEDVMRFDRPILGGDGRALDDRQDVALHALARNVGSAALLAAGDLVDLVDEDDAALFGAPDGLPSHAIHVHQLARLLVGQRLERVLHLHFLAMLLLGHETVEHALQLAGQLLHALTAEGSHEGRCRALSLAHLQLDLAVVESAGAELGAQSIAIRAFTRGAKACGVRPREEVEQSFLCHVARLLADGLRLFLAHHVDCVFDEVSDHRVHVASHVAHLGELAGLDLDEWRLAQAGQTTGDLGFADAGGADHDDVFGDDFFAQFLGDELTAVAVAQGDGHGAFGLVLADDVAIEGGDDLAGREVMGHGGPRWCGEWWGTLSRRAARRQNSS